MSKKTKTAPVQQIQLGSCPTCGGPAQFIEGGKIRHVDTRPVDSVGELTRKAVRGSLRREPKEKRK